GFAEIFWRRRLLRRGITTSTRRRAQKLHALSNHAQSLPLLPLLVLPLIQLQSPFDENGPPFGQVLAGKLGLAGPERHIDERYLFMSLGALTSPITVHGHAHIGHSSATRCVTQ